MKKNYSLKRKALKEQQIQQPQSSQDFAPVPQKPVSLDQIVDRYIVRYERESIPLEGQGLPAPIDESAGIKDLIAFLLSEQAPPAPADEEEAPAEEPAAPDAAAAEPPPGGDELTPPPDVGGGEDVNAAGPPTGAPPVMNTPQINLNNFCRSMARLLNNFDVLLNPKTIILNRAEAYIKSNYDERTAKYFVQTMDRNYSIRSTDTDIPEEEPYPTPYSSQPGAGGGQG